MMIIIFSLLGILLLLTNLLKSFKKGKYITIVNIVSVVTIVDLYIPAILGHLSGKYFELSYVNPLTDSEVLATVIIADFAYAILLFSYNVFKPKIQNKKKNTITFINLKRAKLVFLAAVGIYVLDLFFTYKSFGSWVEFYAFKLARAYAVSVEPQNGFAHLISILSEMSYIIMLMMFDVLLTQKEKIKKREFVFYMTLLIVLSVVSLSRGTIIGVFFSIMSIFEYTHFRNGGITKDMKRRIKKYALIGICCFAVFGGMRNILQSSFFYDENNGIIESTLKAANNTFGNSLIALARTVRYVESDSPLFYGQSYSEMFLSLIPRSIMPSKPQLYGVQTLTMAEGSPETTMDAITMPGELIMNFGYIGVVLMFLWGLIFKIFDSFRYKERLIYFISAAIFALSTTCSWMSFTGFFAQTKYIIVYYLALRYVIKIRRFKTEENYV